MPGVRAHPGVGSERSVWWLAIDKKQGYTSYEELKRRKVAAQGWRQLGNLVTGFEEVAHPAGGLRALVQAGNRGGFEQTVKALVRHRLRQEQGSASIDQRTIDDLQRFLDSRFVTFVEMLWNLLSMRAFDRVVGIEGTTVRGICELHANAWESYQYDGAYNYAQTVGFPVTWMDWDVNVFGTPPRPAGRGFYGVKGLQTQRSEVLRLPLPDTRDADVPVPRVLTVIDREIRSTEVARRVKAQHDFTCQVCGLRLETPDGPYAESAHIRPLGRPHDGPDVAENVLCLCPNDHVRFDSWSIWVSDDLQVLDAATGAPLGKLRTVPGHRVDLAHVRYHRRLTGR